jgi:capsular polysaccharide transport system permease protein
MNEAVYRGAQKTAAIPVLEQRRSFPWLRQWRRGRAYLRDLRLQFIVLVAIPTLLSALYFGLIATKRYVSHAEYIVRGVNAHQSSGIGALLTTIGISRAADDTSVIESFIKSREALGQLSERVNLREIYGRPEADFFSRFPWPWEGAAFERLYARLQSYISVVVDTSTGVTTLEVSAFRPDDAKLIATTLLVLAEGMANRMNERAEADTVSEAKKEVELGKLCFRLKRA